jgi:fused signal recognition particle receptor
MDYLILAAVVAIVLLGAVIGLLVGRRTRERPPAVQPPAPQPREEGPDRETAVGEDAEEPRDTPKRGVDTIEIPEHLAPPPVEVPAPAAGRLVRLRARLARSQTTLGRGLLTLLSRDVLDEETWEEIEDTLLSADLGVVPTQELIERLRTQVKIHGTRTPEELRALLRAELLRLVGPDMERSLHALRHRDSNRPSVVLVVGVNGTGKTTSTGKLARVLVADNRKVLLGAADTFRAAAVDQLQTWGDRVGARTVRGPEASDPASVAYEAVRQGIEDGVDAVIIDTAGRLHTKSGLMDELGKVKRVVEKQAPVDEVLLVLDATTGQNGLAQARVFAEVVDVTGIVLSKLDGTAKGGIVVAVQRELGVPVKLVGLGEGPDDLAPFEPEAFVDALLEGPPSPDGRP